MKKLFFLLITSLLVACDGFVELNQPQEQPAEYYVRYSITAEGAYTYFSDVYYADVYGTGSAHKSYSVRSWTVTIGPVKKGFKASVRNEKGTGNNQIEVSKNNGPFALKASGQNKASYTINF